MAQSIGQTANRLARDGPDLRGSQIVRSTGRAFGFAADVGGSPDQVGVHWSFAVLFLLLQRPGRLGALELLEVGDASILLAVGSGLHEVGNGDRSQQSNDGYDDHNFYQGEAGSAICIRLHVLLFTFLAFLRRCERT